MLYKDDRFTATLSQWQIPTQNLVCFSFLKLEIHAYRTQCLECSWTEATQNIQIRTFLSDSVWLSCFFLSILLISHPLSSNVDPHKPSTQNKSPSQSTDLCKGCRWDPTSPHRFSFLLMPSSDQVDVSATGISHLTVCLCYREVIDKVRERYSQTWKKQEDNYQKFRYKFFLILIKRLFFKPSKWEKQNKLKKKKPWQNCVQMWGKMSKFRDVQWVQIKCLKWVRWGVQIMTVHISLCYFTDGWVSFHSLKIAFLVIGIHSIKSCWVSYDRFRELSDQPQIATQSGFFCFPIFILYK